MAAEGKAAEHDPWAKGKLKRDFTADYTGQATQMLNQLGQQQQQGKSNTATGTESHILAQAAEGDIGGGVFATSLQQLTLRMEDDKVKVAISWPVKCARLMRRRMSACSACLNWSHRQYCRVILCALLAASKRCSRCT